MSGRARDGGVTRVLIVDDDPLIQNLVAAVLAGAHYQLDLASDGPDAIRIARANRPDVVILDVMMPGLDGFEVCRMLRADERTAHARIVMLTAKSSSDDRETAMEAGADAYFTKPFSPLQLIEAVGGSRHGAA